MDDGTLDGSRLPNESTDSGETISAFCFDTAGQCINSETATFGCSTRFASCISMSSTCRRLHENRAERWQAEQSIPVVLLHVMAKKILRSTMNSATNGRGDSIFVGEIHSSLTDVDWSWPPHFASLMNSFSEPVFCQPSSLSPPSPAPLPVLQLAQDCFLSFFFFLLECSVIYGSGRRESGAFLFLMKRRRAFFLRNPSYESGVLVFVNCPPCHLYSLSVHLLSLCTGLRAQYSVVLFLHSQIHGTFFHFFFFSH